MDRLIVQLNAHGHTITAMQDLLRRLECSSRTEVLDASAFSELEDHPLGELDSEYLEHILGEMKDPDYRWDRPVVTMGNDHRVIDGRHRLEAARRAGRKVHALNTSESFFEQCVHQNKSLEQIADAVISAANESLTYFSSAKLADKCSWS